MQQRIKSTFEPFGSVRLHLEDLERMVEAVQHYDQRSLTVTAEEDGGEYDMVSVAEIREHFTAPLHEVKITASSEDGGIHIRVSRGLAVIAAEGDTDRDQAALSRVRAVLERRRRRSQSKTTAIAVLLAAAVVAFAPNTFVPRAGVATEVLILVWNAIVLAPTIVWVSLILAGGNRNQLVPEYRRHTGRFWTANRDQVLVGLISSAAGAAIGFGFALLMLVVV
ncbi:hypothetical protein GCM10009830_10380 [Glycomyces endophyticus]|uniref:Uncharacterized protein n=1 Tax=Glycomyces endophyticus TaxID=480996 RepID=A0ABN2G8D2_9ACTN